MGVVVVTYSSAQDIGATLRALPAAELARVVVVDNASPDETVAVVHALRLPNLEIVEQANVGFGAGNDAGRARLPATAEYVLFLNPDCVISADDVVTLLRYLEARPRCALVGPALHDRAGAQRTPAGTLPTPLTEMQPLLPRPLGRLIRRRQMEPGSVRSQAVGYVEGACMLVRLAAFDEIGGFDHRYFLCFEEMDLARRLRDAGWSVELCADAVAIHGAQASRRQVARFSLYHQYRSQRLYLERWFGQPAARRYARVATFAWWLRRLVGRLDPEDYRVLRAAITGHELPA